MILFLDDSPERTGLFQAAYPDAVCVSTVAECIERLRSDVWKVVSLDHDLNGETHVDSNRADCGMEVVRWVVRNRPIVGRFIVHSWNEKAARQMVEVIRQKGYPVSFEPFGEGMWKAKA